MVTVCHQCKAVHRFGVMEFHETRNKFVMECHDEVVHDMQLSMLLIFTDKVSTGNVEMNSTMLKLRNQRDSIREGTAKQCNNKTWKATHSLASQREQKSLQSREYSYWKMLVGRSRE